jgi:hypothetical protein
MMSNSLLEPFQSILDTPWLSRTRRNHGLEHATLHILAKRYPKTSLAGHSDLNGFWILGDVPTDEIHSAVRQALQRLKNGEHELAVHPNCGTNFATAGVSAGLAASLVMFGAGRRLRDNLERVPLAITMATLALIISQPLGMRIQRRITTSGDPGDMQIVEIKSSQRGRIKAHRVITAG